VLTFDWTSLLGYVFLITNSLAGAYDVVQVVRQKTERMTEEEWLGISNRNEYIYRMAHDQAMDWLADEKRQRAAAKRLKKATILDPDLLRRIKQPRAREAFILRKQNGLSVKEIAKEMDLGVDTVKEYLAKAAEQFFTLDGIT
jgi:DNA-directed RNA polymerase specialized sigma24 family protein